MTKANDLASLLDANGDVVSSALDNVPPSNDASALSTGTLPDGRFPATLPAVSGANLTGIPTPTLTSLGIANHNQLAVDASGYVTANSLDVNDRVLVNNTGNQFLGYDTGGTTFLSRIGASTGVNDFVSNGTIKRMFVGDTGGDVTVGTSNSSLTPTNSFVHLQHGGEISMGAGASPSKDFVLTTGGNVGIGSQAPSFRLAVEDGSGATRVNVRNTANAAAGSGIYFQVLNGASTVGQGTIATQSNGDMAIFTGTGSGAERTRISSGGSVFVAKTATSFSTAGIEIRPVGAIDVTRSGGSPLHLNRTSTDGDISTFYQNGTQVGAIGVGNTNRPYIGSGDTGIMFDANNNAIYPWDTSTNNVPASHRVDLGYNATGLKFNNLYLSGFISDGTNSKTVADIVSGGGKVLQVVSNYDQSTYNLSSSGYFGPSVTITPSSTSSKLLILVMYSVGNSNCNGGVKILQNGSNFMPDLPNAYTGGASSYGGAFVASDDSWGASTGYTIIPVHVQYLHSPSSTSALTYRGYWHNGSGGNLRLNRQEVDNGGRAFSHMTIMEIAG